MTALLLALLVKLIGWNDIVLALRLADIRFLCFLYIITFIVRMLDAVQLKFLLYKLGLSITIRRIFLANSLSAFYSMVVPGDLVAGGAKWLNLSAATGNKALSLNAIIYNRGLILLNALLFGNIALLLENPFGNQIFQFISKILLLLMIAAFFCVYSPRLGPVLEKPFLHLLQSIPSPIVWKQKVAKLFSSIAVVRTLRFKDHFVIFLINLISMLSSVLVIVFSCKSLGIHLPFLVLLWTHSILLLARQLPITINNLGLREGILILVFSQYSIPKETAFVTGIIIFSTHIFYILIGAGYQLALSIGAAKWRVDI